MAALKITCVLVMLIALMNKCEGTCYFAAEVQGRFVMQNPTAPGSSVQYSEITITEDSITIWGHCHRRIGNSVLLMLNSGEASCIRCFHLKLKSKNVLQVHAAERDYISKCYTTEEAALASCPSEEILHKADKNGTEIILYKTKEARGEDIQKEYCPINGRYTFTFDVNDDSEDNVECSSPASELDSCPSGSALNLRFRRCSFENHDITFECLGHWKGPGNQRYLALQTLSQDLHTPRYRCALYHEVPGTGVVYIAFSRDSTCSNNLTDAKKGYETMYLTPVQQAKWPQPVRTSTCRFPSWMHGHWEHLFVEDSTMTYKDHSSFKTYTLKCVGVDNTSDKEKYLVFGRTQCNEEMYNCLWIKKRSTNVLEFQLGGRQSAYPNETLCDEKNFENSMWITQGRQVRTQESPCPISGEYRGKIPDAMGLCAKMSSDCLSPELMYYQVFDCGMNEIFEEREYRCLGQWEERGLLYTYTQRRDINAYECFVGAIVSNYEIFIKEAGEHCQRFVDPHRYGMELNKKASCNVHGGRNISVTAATSPTAHTTQTKPWIPGTESPSTPVTASAHHTGICTFSVTLLAVTSLLTAIVQHTQRNIF